MGVLLLHKVGLLHSENVNRPEVFFLLLVLSLTYQKTKVEEYFAQFHCTIRGLRPQKEHWHQNICWQRCSAKSHKGQMAERKPAE